MNSRRLDRLPAAAVLDVMEDPVAPAALVLDPDLETAAPTAGRAKQVRGVVVRVDPEGLVVDAPGVLVVLVDLAP